MRSLSCCLLEFTSVASRGSGETYNSVKLIKHYEDNKLIDNNGIIHLLRTIVISPTLDANSIFNNLKSLDESDKHINVATNYYNQLSMKFKKIRKKLKITVSTSKHLKKTIHVKKIN